MNKPDFLKEEVITADLFPNQVKIAEKLINKK